MERTTDPIAIRIDWCRRQSAQARTEPEVYGWRAEADGLRDALMKIDHTDHYRLCPPEIRDRYVLGLQDGTTLLRTARMERMIQDAEAQDPAPRLGLDDLSGEER